MFYGDALPDATGMIGEFPSHLADPKDKGKQWHLAFSKAMYWCHKNQVGYFTNEKKWDWVESRTYAQGNQNVEKYNKWCSRLTNSEGKTVSYLDLNWKIVSPAPKFRAVLKGYFSKLQFKPTATSINPEAADDKKRMQNTVWATKILKPYFDALEQKAGQDLGTNLVASKMPAGPDGKPLLPETMEELQLFFNLSVRLQSEISMEMGMEMVLNENDWAEIALKLWEDVIDLGAIGLCCYVDPIGRKIKLRYCDPVNMILDTYRGHDGEAMERIGEFKLMTVSQLKLEAGDQFTEEQYYEMAKNNVNRFGNAERISPWADYINTDNIYNWYTPYDNWNVLVMEWYTDSSDRKKFKREVKNGVKMTYEVPYDRKTGKSEERNESGGLMYSKEVLAVDNKTIYGANWIVGTDYIFNWGKVNDISRPKENPRECTKPMKFYRISNQSVMELMIPYLDSIQLGWLKMQNLKARALPKGLIIDVEALENLVVDGKIMSTKEVLEAAVQSGMILIRRKSPLDDEGYDSSQSPPVIETKGGLGAEFKELLEAIQGDIQSCREVSGISEMFDASPQDPKQLVGTAKLQVAGTMNAIGSMINGFVKLFEKTCIDMSLKFQIMAKYGMMHYYNPALGITVTEFLSRMDSITPALFGIKIEALPTEEDKMHLMEVAKAALESTNDPTKGGINYPDYLKMVRFLKDNNVKLAEAYFDYALAKFKQEQAQIAQQNVQANAQANQQTEKVKAQEELKSLQAKTQLKLQEIEAEKNAKKELLAFEYQLKAALNEKITQHDITKHLRTNDKAA